MFETQTEGRTFTEDEVSQMMMAHRRGLQRRVLELEHANLELLRQIAQLSVAEVNPLVRMLLSAIGFAKGAKTNE